MQKKSIAKVAEGQTFWNGIGQIDAVKTGANLEGKRRDYRKFYQMSLGDQVSCVKAGVPASFVDTIADTLDQSKESVIKMLGFSSATVTRKAGKGETLSPEQGERLIGVARLVGLVCEMVEQSGDPEGFDAPVWVANWLQSPLPALGGRTPASYMDTKTGQELIIDILRRSQSGAYS